MKRQTTVGIPGHQFYNNIIYLYNYFQFYPLNTTMAIINDTYFFSLFVFWSLHKHNYEGLE